MTLIRMTHPGVAGFAVVEQSTFDRVWAARGWTSIGTDDGSLLPGAGPLAPVWTASTYYRVGQIAADPGTGALMARKTNGASRSSFDATEAAAWSDPSVAYVPVLGQPPGLVMTDGQLLGRSDAAGGLVAVNPSGIAELAYAENNSGTNQTGIAGGAGTVDVTGCSITVPISSARPVYLMGYHNWFATVAPSSAGSVGAAITEVSNGVDTPITMQTFPVATTNINKTTLSHIPATRIGTTARPRTFKLGAIIPSTGTYTLELGTNNRRAVICAEAR